LETLINTVLQYNLRQGEIRLQSLPKEPDIVWFADDLGMQTSLPMRPEKWRRLLKPCFKRIYAPFRAAGHSIYMHTDGHIYEIMPDLAECGVGVINPQVRANGLDNLARVCRGKYCLDLDLDRQMFPFCSPQDIHDHVREAVEKLATPEGGLWLHAEIAPDVPLKNVEAICEAMVANRTPFAAGVR